ncbi:MAG: glycosyl transferase group 1 [Rhizobium sp.]|nr:glycosyl transferase group 1 [Rhizobium sp.]
MTTGIPDRPLRILQVLEPSGGGSGRHFLDLCGSLAARGHQVTAIYSPLRAEERFVSELRSLPLKSIHAVRMTRSPSPSDIRAWLAINRVIKAGGPFDVVHGHSSKAGALTRMRMPGAHVPRVYTPHAFRTMDPTLGANGRRIFGGIETLFGKYLTDALICVSRDEQEHAAGELSIPRRVLHTIINGAAPPPTGHRDEIRARLGVPHGAFVFGFVGRLSEQKAPERLISAFQRMAPDAPQSHVVMIGFGPQEADIRGQIADTGFAARIHLTSSVPGPDAMQAFDALVMPSRYEAMSYVMLEAAASGLPMILADVGGASTVLEHGGNGFLVANSDNVAELSEAMKALVVPGTYAHMVAAAVGRKGDYLLDKMIHETERLYLTLASK